jgi:hypothetical protein
MSLVPITSAAEIRLARKTMLATLRRGCPTYRRLIGWQGGSGEYDVQWNANEGFWVCADSFLDADWWVILFGTDDPVPERMLNIVCEINPPKKNYNRRCAGLFVRDMDGTIYLTHSGKIGGGRKGIGKSAFLSNYRGARETVAWPDGKKSEVIVIGRIDGKRLAAQVANFVREVQRFKTSAGRGEPPAEAQQEPTPPVKPEFNEEFSGQRRGYLVRSIIEANCDHGPIVSALARALQAIGFKVANDKNRDLYVAGRNGEMKALFEAKTDVSTGTIYQAIGQLLYHSASQNPPPTLVMVLPATPAAITKRVLERLQIKVLVFGWQEHQPTFNNLTEIIEEAR